MSFLSMAGPHFCPRRAPVLLDKSHSSFQPYHTSGMKAVKEKRES